jgi:hypothetical protein
MPSYPWRRAHGADITAEVVADGRGAWRAKVSLTRNPSVSVTTPRCNESLSAAQAKADALARKTFDHYCDGTCGPWTHESDAASQR